MNQLLRALVVTFSLAPAATLAQTAPEPFAYTVRSGVATNAVITSEPRTVSGTGGPWSVTVSATDGAQYRIGSGSYTAQPGTIAAGQTLTVRHTSATSANTAVITTVTVGGYATEFKSVTGANDRTPDPFDFGTILHTVPATFVESAPQTLGGFNTNVGIVPGVGAQYSVDGGPWTNVSGTLVPGQNLRMRHLTSAAELAYTRTYLTVGGVTGYFTTRNRSATNQPPVAAAGADQFVDEHVAVLLDGTASSDAEGALTYAWTQTAGPAVALAGAGTATPGFTAPEVAADVALEFRLTVTDDRGATASDTVRVTVLDTRALAIADASGAEGDGTLTFRVTVTPSAARDISVDYTTGDLSARTPGDYDGAGGAARTLIVPAGASEVTLSVALVDDAFDENDETFTVALSNPRGAQIDVGLATGTIADDEDKGLLRAGAAKRSITPTQAQIAGQVESYAGGTRLQKFHLGGFGLGPWKVVPSYGGATPPLDLTQVGANPEAKAPCFSHKLLENDTDVAPADCHDHTWVRVLVLEERDGDRVAFVVIDAVGAGNLIIDAVKAEVAGASCALGACIAPADILVGETHTHAGADLQGLWGGVPREWIAQVLAAAAGDAAREAIGSLVPSNLTMARGYDATFNNYRRPRVSGDEEADTTVTLLLARSDEGPVVGSMLTYAAHPTAVGTGDFRMPDGTLVRVPHPDYPVGATDELERAFGGTALYYNGPIADASGSGPTAGANKYEEVKSRGRQLAQRAQQFLAAAGVPLDPVLATAHADVLLPITNPAFVALGLAGAFNGYYQFTQVPRDQIPGLDALDPQFEQLEQARNQLPQLTPVARTLVSRVSIGTRDAADPAKNRLEIVTIPGESTNTFGQAIRRLAGEDAAAVAAPDTHTMLLGLTQNSFGYIIPEEEFGEWEAPFPSDLPYEETVSLGPLTAPLLRSEGYVPLFGNAPEEHVPPHVRACAADPESTACTLHYLLERFGLGDAGVVDTLDDLLDQIAEGCHDFFPVTQACAVTDALANLLDQGVPGGDGVTVDLLLASSDAAVRGCDVLDPSNCLYPFPNDWFTAPAAPGSIQAAPRGTGRRVNIHPLATPRNAAGKPVDPTEWNRSDGFSPGALIATYVPGLSLEQTFGLPAHALAAANPGLSLAPDAPILVLEADTTPTPHMVWSELDANANQLTNLAVPNVGTFAVPGVTNEHGHVERPLGDGRAALLIRPATNFAEGRRYVVVLRKLKDAAGNTLPPPAAFSACARGTPSLPTLQARCAQLEEKVFPVLVDAGVDLDEVYLAWDFTVESTESAIGRLRHMRNDAFASLSANAALDDCTALTDANAHLCAPPQVQVTNVIENPQNGIRRRIEGQLTIPSYLAPFAPAPLDNPQLSQLINAFCREFPESGDCEDFSDIVQGATLPNRLFYSPADGTPTPDAANASDPTGLRYGDGLPDRSGTMTARFLCQIPAQATPDNPARASLYGHGQLDRGIAITYEGTPDVAREHNYMFCAVDWFGFRTGDAVNVLSALVDLSNFPVIPDASQQGMLNFMFLARAMKHPLGLGALPEFQAADGRPVFDRSEIFYNGNSQGGIFGGVVLAASKDVNRGVLGSLGMNYSTLLTRSKNFDQYAGVLYGAYPDPLDRQVLFSMMQMLWDRSENNGYAHHLVDNSAFGGPTNVAKLDTMFGDPQVTMFSAEVMARTMGVPYDNRQTLHVETLGAQYLGANGRRHPGVEPYVGLDVLDFGTAEALGGALIVWDTNHDGDYQPIPPVDNSPPRGSDIDNHDASQKARYGRCQMAHFLRTGGELIDIHAQQFQGVSCPTVPPATPTTLPGVAPAPAPGLAEALAAALARFADALATVPEHLADAAVIPALDALLGGTQQFVADASAAVAQNLGAGAGLGLPPPGSVVAPALPAPQPLLAGVAKKPILVPVGVPLGGYLRPPVGGEYIGDDPGGEFADNIPAMADGCDPSHPESCPPTVPLADEARKVHSPYATYSPPSRGYYDSLVAKAVALYDGHDYIVMVKTDFIGMLDEVVQDVKADVKSRTGIDLRDGLIMSATHTHDGPGALANHSTRYFWLAMDVYQHDVYRRLVVQLADVVVAALGDLRPARIGHGSGDANGFNRFRRGRFPDYAHDDEVDGDTISDADELRRRLGVLRIDDLATDAPIALVMNWGAHGIAFDVENQYFSGDVLGSLEREVEQTFAKPEGAGDDWRAPLAMLVQNTGGDISPSASFDIRGIEAYGKRLAPRVRQIADAIAAFQHAPDLRAVAQRVVLNRERLGYADDEYPYPWGAAQCGNDIAVPFADIGVGDIPGYPGPTKHPYCIFSPPPDAADLADNGVAENGAFLPQDTILAAAKIGDITLLVQPGEPLTEYGVRLLDMAQAEGFARDDTFVWGYANDHVGYILPPVKEDWATFGGAESTTTFWGWKQGQRFLDGNRALIQALRDGSAPPAHEFQVNYDLYRERYDATPPPPVTPSLLPGEIVAQPDDIVRFGTTRFTFEGGDPVLDLPSVRMERGDGTPVRRVNGERLDTFFEMHLKYRLVSGRHLWTVEFEAPKDWPLGSYRFVAHGTANQGTDRAYAVESTDFTVAPASNLQVQDLACDAAGCSARIGYAPVPMNYRIVDASVDADESAPMRTGAATFTNGVDTVVVPADGTGLFSATIGGDVRVSAIDGFGNTTPGSGAPSADADGDGVADASDECPGTTAGTDVNANGCPREQFPLRFDQMCDPVFDAGCLSDLDAVGAQGLLDSAWNTVFGNGTPAVVNDPIDPLLFDCTGPAGDPAPGTPGFAFRDAENVFCTEQRHQDKLSQPANIQYMLQNYGADPYRAPARHDGRRWRHDALMVAGAEADVYRPCAAGSCSDMPAGLETFEPPYPVAIVLHGFASDKQHLEWASQPLAERGYFVVAVNGTGSSLPNGILDWLHGAGQAAFPGDIDTSRIGITGHSLGAENSTRTQGDPRVSGIVAWDPCDGSGGNECRDSRGSRLHDKGAAARTPTLFFAADYPGFPGYAQPRASVPGTLRVAGFEILRTHGVDTMLVTPRATTHLDWAGAFTFGNRLNEATSLHYTAAWFDRYVKARLVVDSGGNVVAQHGRTEAAERAFRQAIADEAFARLTATHFDGMVDRHNISQGFYDEVKAIRSGDLMYGGNVPYRVAGLPLADRLSFYYRSVCFVSRPDLVTGGAPLARADTGVAGDMRVTGCPRI